MIDAELFYNEVMQSLEDYEKADCYFRGAPPEIIANPKLATILGIDSNDFNENYSAIPVKVMADRINLAGFNVPDDDAGTELLQQTWINSLMHLEFEGFIRDTIKYGDGYLEVWTREDGSADICPADVKTSRMIYFAGDIRVKLFFGTLSTEVIQNSVTGQAEEVPLVTLKYADRIETWIKSGDSPKAEWVPFEEELWETNPYNEVPAFHFRNETPYGIPAHFDAYGSQNQLVKAIANLMGVLDFAGLPERWALLDSTNPQENASYGTPGEDPMFSDEPYSTQAKPGAITLLNARQAGTFEVSKTTEFLAVKDSALKSMSALTGTPMRFFADPSGNHPAGDSLRAADLPLRNKIHQHERMYGYSLAEALSFVLEVLGKGENVLPLVRWEPQVVDADKELLEAAELKLRLGIPQRQVLAELGYSDSQLDAWKLDVEEQEVSDPVIRSNAEV